MAFCIYCGKKLGENDRFCGTCGAKVTAAEPTPAVTAPAPAESATIIYQAPAPEPKDAEPVFAAPAVEEPAASVVEEPAASVVEEPAAPVTEAPAGEIVSAFTGFEETPKTVFTPPAFEESSAEPLPREPLYAAPITREHVRNSATPAGAQPMPFGNKSARGSSASYSYATAERVANPVQNKAVRPKRKFLAAFFSVILCILLLISMLPAYSLLLVRGTLSSETFLAMMQRIDLNSFPASILDESDASLRGLTAAEALCDELNNTMTGAYPEWDELTTQELDQFLDESAFLPFIADHAEGILKALVAGEDSYRIPTKQIISLLEHDVAYLADTLNLPMEDVNLEELSNEIVEEFQLDDLVLPAPAEIDEEVQIALDGLRIVLSVYALGAVCLALLLLVLLLFAANHRDPMYAVRDVGIVSVLGTILPLLTIFGARGAIAIFAGQEAEMYLFSVILSCILDSTFIPVVAVFGLGIVLLIVNGIVRKVQKKKAMA